MESTKVSGVIELQAQVFAECPEYATLVLRTREGELIEVFLLSTQVQASSEHYQAGQVLSLTGGEWQTELSHDGEGEYRRFWPLTVEYDA